MLKHELEELRIKVRILEGRKVEDQDRIRSLEMKAAEADTLRSARVKLQGQLAATLDGEPLKLTLSSQVPRDPSFAHIGPAPIQRSFF